MHYVRGDCDGSPVVALVGNKADLLADARQVSCEEGRQRASEVGAQIFVETSAKCGENVDELFQEVARQLPNPEERPAAEDPPIELELAKPFVAGGRSRRCFCWPLPLPSV